MTELEFGVSYHCINKLHDKCERYVILEIEPQVFNIEPMTGKLTTENREPYHIPYRCKCSCHENR